MWITTCFGVRKVTFYQFLLNIFFYKRSPKRNLSTTPLVPIKLSRLYSFIVIVSNCHVSNCHCIELSCIELSLYRIVAYRIVRIELSRIELSVSHNPGIPGGLVSMSTGEPVQDLSRATWKRE